jgi:hypothetical protein
MAASKKPSDLNRKNISVSLELHKRAGRYTRAGHSYSDAITDILDWAEGQGLTPRVIELWKEGSK